MKGVLRFKLPEEQEEFKDAQDGSMLRGVMQEFDNFLRYRYKHVDPPSESARKEYEEIKKRWHDFVANCGVW